MGINVLCILLLIAAILQQLLLSAIRSGTWEFLWLIAGFPFFGLWILPFVECLSRNLLQAIQLGMIKYVRTTSWSGKPPSLQCAMETGFCPPAITLLIPIYKEDLGSVLKPTIRDLLNAVQHYERTGGKASIIIGDDGLQVIDENSRAARIAFYQKTGLSWVARPKHSLQYQRVGKSKWASNMNNVCQLAIRMRDQLSTKQSSERSSQNLNDCTDAIQIYHEAITMQRTANWVGGDLRMGDLLYVGDGDHRVPEDFLQNLAMEFFLGPHLGELKFRSGPMIRVGGKMELWTAWFKDIEDFMQESYARAGSTHLYNSETNNPFAIRVDALERIQEQTQNHEVKFWNETLVLGRFDLDIRLLIAKYRIKWADYPKSRDSNRFMQGVAPGLYKYTVWMNMVAYGTSEIIFNPFRTWLWRGPFTPLFRALTVSQLTLAQKIGFYCSCATPFTIASSFPLAIFHYFYLGLYPRMRNSLYTRCWMMFLMGLLAMIVYVCLPTCNPRSQNSDILIDQD